MSQAPYMEIERGLVLNEDLERHAGREGVDLLARKRQARKADSSACKDARISTASA
jgi:hypothetical protein